MSKTKQATPVIPFDKARRSHRRARLSCVVILSALAATLGLFGSGCTSASTLQTARTLDDGQYELAVGGGYYHGFGLTGDVRTVEHADDTVSTPAAEVGVRVGLSDSLDAGGRLGLVVGPSADIKWQFVDASGFAMAMGLGAGISQFRHWHARNSISTSKTLDLFVPLYASYDLYSFFSVYVSPKVLMRTLVEDEPHVDWIGYAGATAGVKVGEDYGFYAELSQMQPLNIETHDLRQTNVAWFIDF